MVYVKMPRSYAEELPAGLTCALANYEKHIGILIYTMHVHY
jgi:hypothetical protein